MNRAVLVVASFGLTVLYGAVSAQETRFEKTFQEVTPAQEKSASKGLLWLQKNQNNNGLWGCEKAGVPSAAITGLSIMALGSTGSTPQKGPYARSMRTAMDRLLKCQAADGRIMLHDSTGIGIFYDHSTATLSLAEVYGMMRDDRCNLSVRRRLEKAVSYLYKTQNDDGGWDAEGSGSVSDLAITCSVWMALRSAHNAGLSIEGASVEKLEKFVKDCARPNGGFVLSPNMGNEGLFYYPTTAGLRILYGMGRGDALEVRRGTRMLLDRKLGQEHGGKISEWDYCGAFYAVQGLIHENGHGWRTYYPKLRDQLIDIQNKDGSWTIEYCLCCRAYATALSVLCLQSPHRMLPIFQL